MTDYKNTLNLPKSDFPMKADLVRREPQRLERWLSSRLYERIQARRASAPRFILHDGPPFANGDVHIGTALNKILKDIILRHESLRGRCAPFVPGWDCHGLPIEFKVAQELQAKAGASSAPPSAGELRQACAAYARRFIDLQRRQFQRLGVLGDWDHPYLTFLPQYEADELRLFADLVEQGFVYRGKKPVYWSIPCRTALAEAEVEYQDHVSPSIYVKFPVAGRPGTYVVIWTTTPWTLPANLAIAYNSTFSYSLVMAGEETYIVSVNRLNEVAEQCGWGGFQIIRSLHAEDLAQMECRHPFIDRAAPLLAGDAFVESTTGTGFVHTAPGHGLEDYQLGRERGLPIYSPVDDDGRLALTADLPEDQQMPAGLVGKSILESGGRSEANEAVLALLQERGMLLRREDYHHSYPHCWRSKSPIIFRAMDQWFIRIDHGGFRERALAAIGEVRWLPEWGRNRIEAAVQSRPDWCISRQRSWGVPIPAFYDASGQPILDARIIRKAADWIERHGSNWWYERPFAEIWAAVRPADWAGPEPAAQSWDTLDVWIDSGSSSRSVLMRRPELQRDGQEASQAWRADLYLEGSDQHRGWFQSSLLLSLAAHGAPPYRTVLTHGFMVDADREKISKSRQGQGGYEKPQTAEAYVGKYGADVVRLWVASQDYRNDVVVSEERIAKVGETYRLIRNALRFQLGNLYDFDPARDAVPAERMTGLDRWVLEAFRELEVEAGRAYEAHEFHSVYQKISQFVAVELSAVYHDVVKDRLYTDPAGSPRRRSTQTALYRLVAGLCRMLSPILVFTADEAWEHLPGASGEDSVHLADWDPEGWSRPEAEQAAWRKLFEIRSAALAELEKARQAKVIGKSLEARLALRCSSEEQAAIASRQEELRELLNVSQLEIEAAADGVRSLTIEKAQGRKCERCWHWEPTVGVHVDHPGLCDRCIQAVADVAGAGGGD